MPQRDKLDKLAGACCAMNKNTALSPRVGIGHCELICYKKISLSIELGKDASGTKDGRYMVTDVCQHCREWKEHSLDRFDPYQVEVDMYGRVGQSQLNLRE